VLNVTDQEHWDTNGWLWVRRYWTVSELRNLRLWTDSIGSWPEVPGKWMRYSEQNSNEANKKTLARIENIIPYHEGLSNLLLGERVMPLRAACAGEPVVLFKDKINMKLPGGGAFTPHQDAPAYVDFGVHEFFTLMVPIDRFTEENGCLFMACGVNERVFHPQQADGTLRPEFVESLRAEPLLADPGDVIIFNGWVPHWSGPNHSSLPRRSYYLTFNPASSGDHRQEYFTRKRKVFPPECERKPGIDYLTIGRQFNLGNPIK